MKTNIEHQYLKLLQDIIDNGVEKQDRTGTGTVSVLEDRFVIKCLKVILYLQQRKWHLKLW
jgi:thymidylate synthase